MSQRIIRTDSKKYTLLLGLSAAFLVICIVMFPDKSFNASLHGLALWWKIIFPALLPFLILTELLKAYGILHMIGVYLEPLMRLVFRIPGIGAPVIAIGCTIGYPVGAKLTAELRKNKQLTRSEGELLLLLSHLASPVLVINVIAVGFLMNAQLGLTLLIVQISALLLTGLFMRLCIRNDRWEQNKRTSSIIGRSFEAMYSAYLKDGRTFGRLLGDSVTSAIQTLMMIGGYMMMFSVIVQIITITELSTLFYAAADHFIPEPLLHPLLTGMMEVHLGTYAAAQAVSGNMVWPAAIISCLLAFSGISVHLQVKSLITHTDLRYSTFLIGKIVQAGIALWLTFWLWSPLNRWFGNAVPGFVQLTEQATAQVPMHLMQPSNVWIYVLLIMGICLTAAVFVSILLYAVFHKQNN